MERLHFLERLQASQESCDEAEKSKSEPVIGEEGGGINGLWAATTQSLLSLDGTDQFSVSCHSVQLGRKHWVPERGGQPSLGGPRAPGVNVALEAGFTGPTYIQIQQQLVWGQMPSALMPR
ncbi:hypothetical protein NDU88_012716 [Pleurodeles waltl]|uniref:Uncharacterized protein n=1 Tax=Pleurodeles waltl TaxID=8319 RepID=A0AAV7R4L6_PLEWA|nr:hypothetical protein NDU88_012716 [Pleurodeles waltl]